MGGGAGIYYTSSPLNKFSYQQRESITGQTGRHPQIATLDNLNTIIAWDETSTVGDSLITKIKLRMGSSGKNIRYDITPEATNAVYPVLSIAKDKRQLLIAYTNKSGLEKYIGYKQMNLPD